jgi:MFS family permease
MSLTPLDRFLDREQTIAPRDYNRWLIPPAALAIHLCIGEVYAFSVFNLPLSVANPGWDLKKLGWIFSLAMVFLGLSAALFGRWLERVGPRRAMFTSACCFSGGFFLAALGVTWQRIELIYLGYGVLGGIGLGIGYISPVSTLIKWFPDRAGLATGLAIMGFGGGAMIGSPLSQMLLERFRSPLSTGIAETFVALGAIYFAFMLFGVLTVRLPAPDWKPNAPGVRSPAALPADRTAVGVPSMRVEEACRTPQFWLLWCVLGLNVTAGIGVFAQASPMIQEMFPTSVTPPAAAGFVGLLSLFNMGGRLAWSSLSDRLGRKNTYTIFFLLGAILYALTPQSERLHSVPLFVGCFAIIMSMYGGGFATIPAYLRDLFGTAQVGAIHGRLLTAWSLAGVAGPVLVASLREYQIERGIPKTQAYSVTMYLMAVLLLVGLACNLLVRPTGVANDGGENGGQAASMPAPDAQGLGGETQTSRQDRGAPNTSAVLATRWAIVLLPLAWGVWQTLLKSLTLFGVNS